MLHWRRNQSKEETMDEKKSKPKTQNSESRTTLRVLRSLKGILCQHPEAFGPRASYQLKKKIRRIYIARQCTFEDYGFKQINDENIFLTFKEAERYINYISDPISYSKGEKQCRNEIISYIIADKSWAHSIIWEYTIQGKFITDSHKKNSVRNRFNPMKDYMGKYNIGNFVYVDASPWNPYSCREIDTLGVIAWKPLPYNEWIRNKNNKKEWSSQYIIDFINNKGYLDHLHIEEPGIKTYKKRIPNKYSFLKTLQDHYLNKKCINKRILKDLYNGKIFVEKVNFFSNSYLVGVKRRY